MSDIVERLRDVGVADNETYRTCLAAAAEIERLSARIAALEGHLRWVAGWADRHAYQALSKRIIEVLRDVPEQI